MPLYDIRCKKCGMEFEAMFTLTERDRQWKHMDVNGDCLGELEFLITCLRSKDWFKPFIQEDFNGQPIEVKSRRHYKELCKKYGCTARCL